MLKKTLLVLAALILCLGVVIALQPSSFQVTRSATLAAPPEAVFPLVNDFHNWDAWSPWAKLDPAMKTSHGGPGAGAGATYAWTGNSQAGQGRMEILESRAGEWVRIKLDFIKPFESTSDTNFAFKPGPAGTTVTWTMGGANTFLGKAFCLFTGGMDKAIGPDFERGLAKMKAVAEAKK